MKLIIFIISALLTLPVFADQPMTVRLGSINSENDFRYQYSEQLLELVLKSSHTEINIEWIAFPNEQHHLSLLDNGAIDVLASATDKELERKYHAIRYPLFKGLMGYRLILVRSKDRDILANAKEISDLIKFTVGQGSQWQETKIFSDSGFVVNTSRHYDRLFEMLDKKRFDIFPRSVLEVWNEEQIFSQLDIVIDPHVVLHYPMALFYFVRKNDATLSQVLEKGFKVAIENGSFNALFKKHHNGFIKRANLDNRTLIEIPNPFSPPVPSNESNLYITIE